MTHTVAMVSLPASKYIHAMSDHKEVFATVDVTAYTASGEVLSASEFGLKNIAFMQTEQAAGHTIRWDGSKLRAYVITTGIEAAGNADLHDIAVRVIGY